MGNPRLLDILSRADAELRSLIEELAKEGAYGDVASTARIAQAVAGLKEDAINGTVAPLVEQPTEPHEAIALPKPGTSRRRGAKDYPKFGRDGDKLVKTAWSKRDRAEYEHRAPRTVVDLLLQTIVKKKGEGRKFEASEVLPIKDPATRQELPSYQSYMALAWLRAEGVVTKKGRNGYVLKSGAASPERISQLWEALPIH